MEDRLYIGGRFVPSTGGGVIEVHNPHDGTKLADVAEARAEDVDHAVRAASEAFPPWASMAAMERGRLLLRLADAI